jgi:hypothetical protein
VKWAAMKEEGMTMDTRLLCKALEEIGATRERARQTALAVCKAIPSGSLSFEIEFCGEKRTAKVTNLAAKGATTTVTDPIVTASVLKRQFQALKNDVCLGRHVAHILAGASWRIGLDEEEFEALRWLSLDEAKTFKEAAFYYMYLNQSQPARHFTNIANAGETEYWPKKKKGKKEFPKVPVLVVERHLEPETGSAFLEEMDARLVVVPRIYLPEKPAALVQKLRQFKHDLIAGRRLGPHPGRQIIPYSLPNGFGEF